MCFAVQVCLFSISSPSLNPFPFFSFSPSPFFPVQLLCWQLRCSQSFVEKQPLLSPQMGELGIGGRGEGRWAKVEVEVR